MRHPTSRSNRRSSNQPESNRLGKGWSPFGGPLSKPKAPVHRPVLTFAAKDCPRTAKDSVLFYEEPLIVWLPAPGRNLLAIACETEDPNRCPMLVCELTAQQARALEAREEMLCDAIIGAQRWFDIPDYNAPVVELFPRERPPRDLPELDGYLP